MPRIRDFLNQYPGRGTRYSYSTGVNAFISFIYQFKRAKGQRITPEDRAQLEMFAERYVMEGRNYEQDMINFSNYCTQHYAPTSGRLFVTIAKEFLSFNDIEFTRKQEKKIRNKIPNGGPISEEAELTKDMLQKVLNACDIRMKALVLMLINSGMRIGEATQIHDTDITISEDGTYASIYLRGVSKKRGSQIKNRHSRTVFIGKEAVKALQQWREVKDDYIDRSCKRSKGRWQPADLLDGRVFPFGIPSLSESLRNALKKAKLFKPDDETGRSLIHFHLFRKYFITTMTNSGIPEKFVDFYAGHIGELDRAYQKQTREKLLEMYKRGEPYLRIYDESAEEIAKTKEEMKETKERIRDIQLEHLMTKSRFDEIKREKDELESRVLQLEKVKAVREQAELQPEYQALMDKFKAELMQMQEKQKN